MSKNIKIHNSKGKSLGPFPKNSPPEPRPQISPATVPQPAKLREGFTTGSAAAAAAAAATHLLLGKNMLKEIYVTLPSISPMPPTSPMPPISLPALDGQNHLCIPIKEGRLERNYAKGLLAEEEAPICATCVVIKDGGDDPDVTSGLDIVARVCKIEEPNPESYPEKAYPEESYAEESYAEGQIILKAGKGIGTVTLPGLPLAVGEFAINPVPRRQIILAVKEAALACNYFGHLEVTISVPKGEEAAKKTLNQKLGILGGISILGTGGTVRPFSHKAWANTLTQNINIIVAQNRSFAGLCTGRRSEELLKKVYPSEPAFAFMQVADFIAFAVREAAQKGLRHIALGCFFGKLLKIAEGLEYTHAHSAAINFLPLARLCQKHEVASNELESIEKANTAQQALGIIKTLEAPLQNIIIQEVKERAKKALTSWAREAGGENMRIDLHLFEF